MTHLGELLWARRFEKRITCREIARAVGYGNTNKGVRHYLRWERGEAYPPKDALAALIHALGLGPQDVKKALEQDPHDQEKEPDRPLLTLPLRIGGEPVVVSDPHGPGGTWFKIGRPKNAIIATYGYYRPDLFADQREVEMKLLRERFDVILKNTKTILENDRYFFCRLGPAFLSLAWIGPGGPIPLGGLVLLWQRGELLKKCPDCGGTVYVLGAGGSALSGSHGWWGICPGCRTDKRGRDDGPFGALWRPIQEILTRYPNKRVVIKGKRRYFSWKNGLTGEATPDMVVKEKIDEINIKTLIEELTPREPQGTDG